MKWQQCGGHLDAIQTLLAARVDIDQYQGALQTTTTSRKLDIVEAPIAARANVPI